MNKKNCHLLNQFFKFGLVGLSNTAISMGIYYLFLWIDPDLYLVGGIVGGVISIANSFFWNDHFVFKGSARDIKSTLIRLGKTYVSYSGSNFLGLALLWIEVNLLLVSKSLAPIINLAITVPLNFIVNKYWTFGSKKLEPPPTQKDE